MDKSPGLDTQLALAKRTGISQAHLSDILNCATSTGVDLLAGLADAFGVQPMELLADSETARREAIARMLFRDHVPDEKVEKHLPLPPASPEGAPRRKKPGRNLGGSA